MSKALDRLLARTLDADSSGAPKHDSRGRRKAKRKQLEAIQAERARADPVIRASRAKDQRMKNLARLRQAGEKPGESDLAAEIISKLAHKPTATKKAAQKHSFPGLTPGLAPVDYNPDESSDDEPY